MLDEIFDRDYQVAREALSATVVAGVTRLEHAVHNAFQVLNRIEYQAPWTVKSKRARCN